MRRDLFKLQTSDLCKSPSIPCPDGVGSTGAAARSDTLVRGSPRPGSKRFPCPGVSEVGTDPHSEIEEVGDESPMEEGAQGLGRVCGLLLRGPGQSWGREGEDAARTTRCLLAASREGATPRR